MYTKLAILSGSYLELQMEFFEDGILGEFPQPLEDYLTGKNSYLKDKGLYSSKDLEILLDGEDMKLNPSVAKQIKGIFDQLHVYGDATAISLSNLYKVMGSSVDYIKSFITKRVHGDEIFLFIVDETKAHTKG